MSELERMLKWVIQAQIVAVVAICVATAVFDINPPAPQIAIVLIGVAAMWTINKLTGQGEP